MKKAELLVPVGNYDNLIAAIANGADAVYLGGKRFGARAFSQNFSNEELIDAIRLCHLYGVKIYITVNTMIFNDEVAEFVDYIGFLYKNGVDAVIMQDFGMINLVRRLYPDLSIHVSTQAHNHNKYGVDYYKSIGCDRVVFARECSLDYINSINVDIEKEVFVYGALCVCYSGNCLFSALNGGRSGNRGECAQVCRLKYSLEKNGHIVDNGYLLSTKDLNTLDHLKNLLDSGIDSLKIEGRMKSKEYVACVTRIYRKLIDSYYNGEELVLTSDDVYQLNVTFNREFTKGYLFDAESVINSKTSNHQGVLIGEVIDVNDKYIKIKLSKDINQEDGVRFKKANCGMIANMIYDMKKKLINGAKAGEYIYLDKKFDIRKGDLLLKTSDSKLVKELNNVEMPKVNVSMKFVAKFGSEIYLSMSDGVNEVNVSGSLAEMAKTSPISKERVFEQLNKLGNTCFKCELLSIEMDDNLFINLKELNELRRSAVEKLSEARMDSGTKIDFDKVPVFDTSKGINKISVFVRNEEQHNTVFKCGVDIIYTDNFEVYKKYKDVSNIFYRLNRVMENFEEFINERLLCCELGSVIKYANDNKICTDYFMNVANDYSIDALIGLNVQRSTLSIENDISRYQNYKLKDKCEVIVYGYPECMVIKNDILNLNSSSGNLIDVKNNKFKVYYDGKNTRIMNCVPINLIDEIKNIKDFSCYRLEFFDEDTDTIEGLINELKMQL